MLNIYEQLKQANVKIDNHESDLYCPVNETTKAIIARKDLFAKVTM